MRAPYPVDGALAVGKHDVPVRRTDCWRIESGQRFTDAGAVEVAFQYGATAVERGRKIITVIR